jgi:hypothetical protein
VVVPGDQGTNIHFSIRDQDIIHPNATKSPFFAPFRIR